MSDSWTPDEQAAISALASPDAIQSFLDAIPYSADPIYRCPRSVIRDRKAHCFDGAVFAAAMLRQAGQPPLILDMRAVRDDDHVITIFRREGWYGAVAKSNCTGLRFREPIFRSLRELILSYFEDYFNVEGLKSLRSYSPPLDLRQYHTDRWEFRDEAMDRIATRLDTIHHYPLLTPAQEQALRPMDARGFAAGFLGSDEAGLFRP